MNIELTNDEAQLLRDMIDKTNFSGVLVEMVVELKKKLNGKPETDS